MQGMTLESLKNHVGIAPLFVMSGITLAFIASAQCKSSSETKYPEVLIAVDYSLHKNLGENEARTQQYVQNHFTAVNAMFANLSEPKIKLVLAGVIIGTSAASLPFLHEYGSYSQQFEADDALSSMGQHYAKGGFHQHDLVMALTAQDMQIRGRSMSLAMPILVESVHHQRDK